MENNKVSNLHIHRILSFLLSLLLVAGIVLPAANSFSLKTFASEFTDTENTVNETEADTELSSDNIEVEATPSHEKASDSPNTVMDKEKQITVEEILAQNQSDLSGQKSRRQVRGNPAQTKTIELKKDLVYTITSADNGKYDYLFFGGPVENAQIIVNSGYTGTIKISNALVNFTTAPSSSSSFLKVSNGADVTLVLIGKSEIIRSGASNATTAALIQVEENGYLTIESSSGTDAESLKVEQNLVSGLSGAAIGSNYIGAGSSLGATHSSGHITINSGTIHTAGGDDGAGIGGGSGSGGGYITINGGNVTGINDSSKGGANSAAGIGAGAFVVNTKTYIRINGGDVTAVSLIPPSQTLCGAAIGAGNREINADQGHFGYILITGGKIRASVRGDFSDPNFDHETSTNPGTDGVAIGGGARPDAKGTIIVLPSADITEVYGAKSGWDIGNATELFYLNNSDARVAVLTNAVQKTKKFTMRTVNNDDPAELFARVHIADQYLPAFATKVGTINKASGDCNYYGTPYFYTNGKVDFYSTTKDAATNGFYKVESYNDSSVGANPNEIYNLGTATEVFNVVLGDDTSPIYEFKMYGPVVADGSGMADPNIPGIDVVPPGTESDDIHLYFGEWLYSPTTMTQTSTIGYKELRFKVSNEGSQNFNFDDVDVSKVISFDLEGPIVAPPAVEGGGYLPSGSEGYITVRLKNTTRAGNRTAAGVGPESFKLVAVKADGSKIEKNVYLHLNVQQLKVEGLEGANVSARRPTQTVPAPIHTNATSVTVRGKSFVAGLDGVKSLWYIVTEDETPPAISATGKGAMPTASEGWTEALADKPPNGFYDNIFDVQNIDLPGSNGDYYVHWYIETENTIGSSGTVGKYDVRRDPNIPVIKKDAPLMVNDSEFEATITFAYDVENINMGMFTVTNGTMETLNTTPTISPSGEQIYKFKIKPNGQGDVTIAFEKDRIIDIYGDYNNAAVPLVLPYNSGIPIADFSSIPSQIYIEENTLNFSINTGIASEATLYDNLRSPLTTASAGSIVTITGPSSPTVIGYANGVFTLEGPFTEGTYTIAIPANSIENEPGGKIADTVYTFNVKIPIISGVTASPNALGPVGGNTTVTITGKNLEYANRLNGYTFRLEENGIEFVLSSVAGDGTSAIFNAVLPPNFGTGLVTYTYNTVLKHSTAGASPAESTVVTVGSAVASVTKLEVDDDSGINSFHGGPAVLKITGEYMHNFTSIKVTDTSTNVDYPVVKPGQEDKEAFVTVSLPKNTTNSPITYTFEIYTNDASTGITTTITIAPATPDVTGLKVTEDSGHENGAASLELDNEGGVVYFVVDGLNMHNINLTLESTGSKAVSPLADSDFQKSGADNEIAKSIGITLEKNRDQTDNEYTFEIYKDGIATGKTAKVTVKMPETGVTDISANPTKHPATPNGPSKIQIKGLHMDVAALEVRVNSPVVADYLVVASDFSNNASLAEFDMVFPPHQGGDRNDIYILEAYFDDKATGLTVEVEVGDSVPNVREVSANPNYYSTPEATAGKKSNITIEGNYLENLQSLELYDETYKKMYTVNIAGKDMTADQLVPIPSAIGSYKYTVWVDGVETDLVATINVGIALGTSGPEYEGREDEPNTKKEWGGGPGVTHGGGNKGGGFTGPFNVEFDVFVHHSEQSGKNNPKYPTVTVKDVPYVTADQLTQASSAAKKGIRSSEKPGNGNLTIMFDSMFPELNSQGQYRMEGRLYVTLVTTAKDMYTGVFVRPEFVKETVAVFNKNFGITNAVGIYLAQPGDYGTKVEVAVAADLSDLNTKNLYFYVIDRETGEYKRIDRPEYFIDVEGFLHFDVTSGGTIIVTDKIISPEIGVLALPASIIKTNPM